MFGITPGRINPVGYVLKSPTHAEYLVTSVHTALYPFITVSDYQHVALASETMLCFWIAAVGLNKEPYKMGGQKITPDRIDSMLSCRLDTRHSRVAHAAPILAQYSDCWRSWRLTSRTRCSICTTAYSSSRIVSRTESLNEGGGGSWSNTRMSANYN